MVPLQLAGAMFALFLRTLLIFIVAFFPVLASAQGMRVVARVNDDAITDFDLSQRVLFAIRTTGLQDSPDLRQRLAAQVLRQMIDERLQIQDAKRLGLKPTDSELQQRFSDIERASGMGHGQFRQYMQSVGVPFEIAVQQVEAQIAWGKVVRRKVRPLVDVSEIEIDDTLNRMRANIGKTETRIAEIFVPIDRVELTDDAKRSADRIMEQLRRGAPFASVAQQFSQGVTAAAGGEIGWILPGSLDPILDNAIEKLQVKQYSEPIRSTAGWHILYVIDRRQFAATKPEDSRLNLTQMTLPLPINASPDEVSKATADAQKAMAGVHSCADLHARARDLKGATSGDLQGIRVGDLAANHQMFEELPKLSIGGTAGPYRVAEGLQVVTLCSKVGGGDGLPTREAISQQILLQKLEAAGRRYMRDLRRQATIDIKQPDAKQP
jgi:peptidyl-prolyl cis-trans isomerase SurA